MLALAVAACVAARPCVVQRRAYPQVLLGRAALLCPRIFWQRLAFNPEVSEELEFAMHAAGIGNERNGKFRLGKQHHAPVDAAEEAKGQCTWWSQP